VTIFSFDTLAQSLDTVKMLRTNGVNAEVFLDQNSKLDKQLKYADAKGIPFALIIGPDEVKKDLLTIKNLRTKTQTTTTASDALKLIREEN
jgi:histidyl-tRNA synthetase